MGKATVYYIMHTEKCVAQVSTAGECKIYFEDFMPYGLVLKESNDFDTLDKILELDAHGYYMMNILDYLVGNTDRHWENWGLLVDNETNQPIRLYDLMDFNRAFQQYDTLDGATCLTVGKRHLSQREAAMEAVDKIGLNQICEIDMKALCGHERLEKVAGIRLNCLNN